MLKHGIRARTLGERRASRAFALVDDCRREHLATEVGTSPPTTRVVAVLERPTPAC